MKENKIIVILIIGTILVAAFELVGLYTKLYIPAAKSDLAAIIPFQVLIIDFARKKN